MFDVDFDGGKITIEATRILLVVEKVSMRRGVMGLTGWLQIQYGVNPIQPGTLWLFCGKNRKMLKGLLYRPTGFILIQKTLLDGTYQWPRCEEQIMELSLEKFKMLMDGYPIIPSIRIPKIPSNENG